MENETQKLGLRIAAGFLVAILIIVVVFASGVTLPSLENNPSLGSETGRLNVLLTDAPVELKELNITITDVEVHKSGENGKGGTWLVLVEDVEFTFNLLDYQNGKTLDLASIEIPSGNYTKIRLFVSEANASYVNDPDTVVELTVPPGKIDVITKFELFDGGTRTVIIDMQPDWIAISNNKSLRPVLKATISEQNPPEADFTYTPEDPTTDDEITFDASLSTDVDGIIVNYEWDLGDASGIQTGVEITHTYPAEAEYDVTLTVTDNTGLTDTLTKTVSIQNPPSP